MTMHTTLHVPTGRAAQPFLAYKRRTGNCAPCREAAQTPGTSGEAAPRTRPAVRLPHAPALDGLRALAVGAVLLYHASLAWIPGGFLGVEVFFVISGYLITSLLLAEWSATGRIDLAGFWLRRARRLLPALLLLLLAVLTFAVLFLPDEVAGMRGDAVSGALYVNNWYQIYSHHSYFESAGRPSPLRHLWSLAVEEQFYLLWPLLFLILVRCSCRRAQSHHSILVVDFVRSRVDNVPARDPVRLAAGLVLACAAASALWMAALYQPDADPSRIYYGTDTRAAGILIGVALAFRCLPRPAAGNASCPRAWGVAGAAALGVLTICLLRISEFQPFLYRGGFVLTGLATATLIAAGVRAPGSLISRLFAWAPLRWIGVRSYGIYLWHFPVFMVTRPQLDVPFAGSGLLAARLVLTMLFAAISYQFLELPVRRGAIERFWLSWRAAQGRERRLLGTCGASALLSFALAWSVLGVELFTAEAPSPPDYLATMQTSGDNMDMPRREASPAPADDRLAEDCAPDPAPTNALCAAAPLAAEPAANTACVASNVPDREIVAVGDSVMLGVRTALLQVLGTNVIVDAEVGRQGRHALAAVQKLRREGKIRPVVILHIGANGFISAGLFEKILTELADAREVLVLNVKVPRQWEAPNNEMLAEVVARHPNAVLLDWHAVSENHPEIFWKDGHHLRPKGGAIYASLIAQTLRTGSGSAAPAARPAAEEIVSTAL